MGAVVPLVEAPDKTTPITMLPSKVDIYTMDQQEVLVDNAPYHAPYSCLLRYSRGNMTTPSENSCEIALWCALPVFRTYAVLFVITVANSTHIVAPIHYQYCSSLYKVIVVKYNYGTTSVKTTRIG